MTFVYHGHAVGRIKTKLGMQVGLGPGDFVLDGDPAPSQKGVGASLPIIDPFLLWPNGWMHQDATGYGGRPQPRRLCIRWGHPLLKRGSGQSPQFSAHFYCGQRAGCIKMPLGMEVGLSPCDFVLNGDPAPPEKMTQPRHPIFGPCLLWSRQ